MARFELIGSWHGKWTCQRSQMFDLSVYEMRLIYLKEWIDYSIDKPSKSPYNFTARKSDRRSFLYVSRTFQDYCNFCER